MEAYAAHMAVVLHHNNRDNELMVQDQRQT